AHEIAKAHLARLRLQERKGELVDRARATALVFRLAREERDAYGRQVSAQNQAEASGRARMLNKIQQGR
ncbi:MAG: hypothetical protein N2690_05245, partial [Rhodocyclaceae bacterium]|nr:hypothetical protein [Rhodocyclaceae bacterium]